MTIPRRIAVLSVLLAAVAAQAQSFNPPETRNAALRYWQAFAMMKDQSPSDKSVLANEVLGGEKTWDEAELDSLVEENRLAIETMQKATLLPECDWGVDYSAGFYTPLEHVRKGRELAELNLLYAVRAQAKHDNEAAARAFVAGIRFAHDTGQDGTIPSVLWATRGLNLEFAVIKKATANGQLDSRTAAEIDEALRSLPKYGGFDWAQAVRHDGLLLEVEIEQMRTSSDLDAAYQSWFHEPPPESVPLASLLPSHSEMAEFHPYINDMAEAYELPADAAQARLDQLETKSKSLHPTLQSIIPNLVRINLSRKKLEDNREAVLQQLEKP